MKYTKFSFSLLETIEKKKIEEETIKIKNLYLKKQQNSEQLKLLINYQKEYLKKIHDKMMSGVCVHQWKNYNNFISTLQVIIKENINSIEENQRIIKKSLKKWSANKMKLKVWEYLNKINKKQTLKMKKIQEDIINDNCTQLKFLKKGKLLSCYK
ncbi:flagellar export protein FliJ [Buchnera aphidicola (Acyrthosiphon lactucae)]|uniref:Flagellar FliJ protein n=1 Tax=Buchnera aphidicola (Acyrthosiphon lactucae) TaxID=1241832 RepID=A0A4D6XL61_9GAMM|nr:flagellar FliJ family protein [Buchnera aphidicola]QCI17492.1 flagellar export protein FliJ [Buchnera aphidicola (Acyrthosiphon lactucae)]